MLRINMNTRGMLNPAAVTNITIDAKGTTTTSVSAAKLYYTGDEGNFSPTNLLGTITAGPTGTDYVFTLNQTSPHGNNYF